MCFSDMARKAGCIGSRDHHRYGTGILGTAEKERAGNAVTNRSLACLRPMLKIAHEDGKLPVLPIVRLHKEPARRRLIRLEDDQTKNDDNRYVPLPSQLVMMLAKTER
jgi:hypothetical protein